MYNEEIIVDTIEGNIWIFEHYNAVTNSTNKKGCFGSIVCWINKEGIYNIFSIPKFEEMGFRITYDIRDGHCIVYTKDGEIQFNKYEMVITSTVSNYRASIVSKITINNTTSLIWRYSSGKRLTRPYL